jgi:hypothetical protein
MANDIIANGTAVNAQSLSERHRQQLHQLIEDKSTSFVRLSRFGGLGDPSRSLPHRVQNPQTKPYSHRLQSSAPENLN